MASRTTGSRDSASAAYKTPFNCPYCGSKYKVRPTGRTDRTHEYYCDCPKFAAIEEADRRREEEALRLAKEGWRRSYIDAIGIPRHYQGATPDPSMAADVVANGGLFITGNVGSGKTYAACAMLLAMYDTPGRPHSARYVYVPNLTRRIRSTFGDGSVTEEDVMREYETCGLLVLDDLGKGKQTEWLLEKLVQLVENRYSEDRPIVVTTQYDWAELGARMSESGDQDTTEAILSRLSEMCRTVRFDGPDRRTQRR